MSANLDKINQHRRNLLGAAAMAAAAGFFELPSASAQPARSVTPTILPATNASFGPLKHIDAGLLNVAYAEAGPADGSPVILLTRLASSPRPLESVAVNGPSTTARSVSSGVASSFLSKRSTSTASGSST